MQRSQSKQEEPSHHHFLLFINPRSGGGVGSQYLTIKSKQLNFVSLGNAKVTIHLFDVFSDTDKEVGFKKTLQLSEKYQNINVIVCGGDGTILWVIQEILHYGINPERVCFGVIPIGTGNDFSRSLGWGSSPISFKEKNISELQDLVRKWLRAEKKNFDLWDAEIETYQGGKIVYAREEEQSLGVRSLKRTFSNYLGLGVDARVSYTMEKNRTRNKFINLIIYACIGFRNFCKKSERIDESVSEFSESESQSQTEEMEEPMEDPMASAKSQKMVTLLNQNQMNTTAPIIFKPGYHGLVCLNCTSYMAGVENVFRTNKMAIKGRENVNYTQQAYDDGKLEFVGFKNQLSLGLERYINQAGKVAQGSGPYLISFNKKKGVRKNYVHIDGEAMLVQNLSEIRISKSKLTQSGTIRILAKGK